MNRLGLCCISLIALFCLVFACSDNKPTEPAESADIAESNETINVLDVPVLAKHADIASMGDVPPVFSSKAVCGKTVQVRAGQKLVLEFKVVEMNTDDEVELKVANDEGLPAGASMVPELPLIDNPVSTRLVWTPTEDQIGDHFIRLRAKDIARNPTECDFWVSVQP